MRLFGSDRVAKIMDRMGAEEGEAIEHKLVTRAIQTAQKRVEGHHFDIRKHLLEYDNVMNQQREVIYDRRWAALEQSDLKEEILRTIHELVDRILDQHCPEATYPDDWNIAALRTDVARFFLIDFGKDDQALRGLGRDALAKLTHETADEAYRRREEQLGTESIRQLERLVTLRVIDDRWRDHLYELDQLKSGVGLRAYGQKDPLLEYKQEAFQMFVSLLDDVDQQLVETVFRAELVPASMEPDRRPAGVVAHHPSLTQSAATATKSAATRTKKKVGRNEPCPCGSGKKYKRCCGKGGG
jgi:preprotein translocase subunit SecA